MWRNEFPQLYKLYEASDRSHADNYFTKGFDRIYANDRDGTRRSFGPLERALERVDNEAWKQLVGKALGFVTQKDHRRGWSQLFDHLYEAFGYELLANRGYTSIQFVDRGDEQTPDLLGKSQTSTAILEVKSIGCSDNEIDRRTVWPPPLLDLAPALSDKFENKLLVTLKKARDQLEKYNGPTDKKIVLLVVYMDVDKWGNDNIEAVCKFAKLQQTAGIEVVVRPLVIL
ncbi:MAG: hypothetical protein ABSC38_06050 [Verrucomicrobiia bacterium]